MEDGRIVDSGRLDELRERQPTFAAMLAAGEHAGERSQPAAALG
jgi:hypothetical protein